MIGKVVDPMRGLAKKKLRVFVLVDSSGSMNMPPSKIHTLNEAMREATRELAHQEKDNPFAEFELQVIDFSTGARWHTPQRAPISQFNWTDITADGVTDLGAAIELLTDALTPENMGKRNFPPVILILSDGCPTDEWASKLDQLNTSEWGKAGRTTRVAIAIGQDADKEVLAKFVGNSEYVLEANNVAQLVSFIKYATVTLSSYSSKHVSQAVTSPTTDDRPPPPIVDIDDGATSETW